MAALSDTEEDTIDLGFQNLGGSRSGNLICLAGRLCTSRHFNVYALIDVMLKGFKVKGKVTACEWEDRAWVLQNQPWHFEGNLFAISPLSGSEQPSLGRCLAPPFGLDYTTCRWLAIMKQH
ncbi:hypothetical protein ACS0TY_018531 [Phlomoides rotata]